MVNSSPSSSSDIPSVIGSNTFEGCQKQRGLTYKIGIMLLSSPLRVRRSKGNTHHKTSVSSSVTDEEDSSTVDNSYSDLEVSPSSLSSSSSQEEEEETPSKSLRSCLSSSSSIIGTSDEEEEDHNNNNNKIIIKKKGMKKSVQLKRHGQIKYILPLTQYTKEEISLTWHSHDEITAMKEDYTKEIKRQELLGRVSTALSPETFTS